MSWTTALSDLRTQLADDANARLCHRKKVFGTIDGVNVTFKTFEPRRSQSFTDPGTLSPIGVYVNGVRIANASITSDDQISGEFTLAVAPVAGANAKVEATYYHQLLTDTELTAFLTNASNWLLIGANYAQVPPGLIPAALSYAAKDAFKWIASRYTERASNAFLLEDAPKQEALKVAAGYTALADSYFKDASQLRDGYYTRSGQALAPNFASSWGHVSAVTPRR